MRDIMGMMGKVKEMQAKMEKLQADIAALEVEGKSGGGLVTVKLNGKGSMLGLKIDPSLFKEAGIGYRPPVPAAGQEHAGYAQGRGVRALSPLGSRLQGRPCHPHGG